MTRGKEMKFKVLYKDKTSPAYKRWGYYIFINYTSMIVIDREFKDLDIRYDLNWDFVEEENFYEVKSNKLDVEKQKFLIRNILK